MFRRLSGPGSRVPGLAAQSPTEVLSGNLIFGLCDESLLSAFANKPELLSSKTFSKYLSKIYTTLSI